MILKSSDHRVGHTPDSCYVVLVLDTDGEPAGEPGRVVEFYPSFVPYLPTWLAGGEIEPIISDDKFGWLLNVCTRNPSPTKRRWRLTPKGLANISTRQSSKHSRIFPKNSSVKGPGSTSLAPRQASISTQMPRICQSGSNEKRNKSVNVAGALDFIGFSFLI